MGRKEGRVKGRGTPKWGLIPDPRDLCARSLEQNSDEKVVFSLGTGLVDLGDREILREMYAVETFPSLVLKVSHRVWLVVKKFEPSKVTRLSLASRPACD